MTEGPKSTGEGGAANGATEPNEWELMAQEAAKKKAAEEGEDFDQSANDETNREENAGMIVSGESRQLVPWNTWGNYVPRDNSGESNAQSPAEPARLNPPKVETNPYAEDEQFVEECKDWYERIADAKSKFEPMDGESEAAYERRMNTVAISNISTEIANHKERFLNDVEYSKVTEMYPREKDEEYNAYLARVKTETGIDLKTAVAPREQDSSNNSRARQPEFVSRVVDTQSTEIAKRNPEANAEKAQIEKMRGIIGSKVLENIRKKYGVSDEDLKNLSDEDVVLMFNAYKQQLEDWAKMAKEEGGAGYDDEELKKLAAGNDMNVADLMSRYNQYIGNSLEAEKGDAGSAESSETAEQMEKLRESMIRGMSSADLRDILEAEGVMVDDMENMDAEQLKELQEKLRKRMFEAFGADNGIGDYLERDDIRVDDLEGKDFEGMKDQREKYRQEFMHDLSDEALADKLKERNIRIDDLEAMTMEELLGLKKDLSAAEQTQGGEKGEEEDKKEPLIAVMINRERDAKIAARQMAEDMFQDKLTGDGKKGIRRIVRNLVFGQMLKEATMLKYEREAMDAIENGGNEVRGRKVGEYWSSEGDGASGKVVERLTLAYTAGAEESLLHSAAGNEMDAFGMEVDENGNKVVFKYTEGGNKKETVDANSAEAKSTIAVHEAIAAFASGKMSEADFEEAMKREKANMAKEGLDTSLMSDTLLETAKAAKERFNHEESIENVMEGFRLINADYQAQVRTEVHRSKIDEISEKISGKLGVVQPEVIAAAAGIAVFFTQKATTSALRAAVPVVGGALAAGTFAGFKEHNRVAVDRAEQARRIARGEEIGNTKYDRQMKETEYSSYAATDLTATLKKAIESGDVNKIQSGLATIEALSDYSDSNKVDLIKFSGGDNTTIEDERLALDVQIAQAKVELRKQGIDDNSKVFVEASRKAYEAIENDIDAKDKAFKKLQAKRVAAQFAKTAAIGVATAVVGQEVSAAFNPDSYGLFDKFNDVHDIRFAPLNIGVNNLDAHKTLLAGFLGINQEQVITTVESITAAEATGAKLTDEQVNQLRQEGYTVNERTVTTTNEVTSTETISAADYARENGVYISRNWGNNGTNYSDGNELGLWQADDGHLYTNMSGNSYSGNMSVNFGEAAESGNIKLLVSLSRDSQSTPIEVPGVLNSSGQLDFISDDPAINEIINNGQYAFAEVAYDTGDVASSGAEQMFIFATDVGSNSVSDLTQEVTNTVVSSETVFDVIGFENQATQILQGSDLIKGGIAFPFAGRRNLTRGKKGEGHGPSGPQSIDNGPINPTPNPSNGGGNDGGRAPAPKPAPNETEPQPVSEPVVVEKPAAEGGDVEQDKPAEQGNTEQQEVNNPVKPERTSGDISPIELTSDQIRELVKDEDYADIIKARIDYEIPRWNSYTEEQRRKILEGDYSWCASEEDAEWTKRSAEYLRKYGVLNYPEPSEIKMPAPREDPMFHKSSNVTLKDGTEMHFDRNGNVTIDTTKRDALRAKDSFEPINDKNDTRDIDISDKRIKELNPNNAPTEAELKTIHTVMMGWNKANPQQRKMFLEGHFNGSTKNLRVNRYLAENFNILRKFNIITLPEEEGISDEGEARMAA